LGAPRDARPRGGAALRRDRLAAARALLRPPRILRPTRAGWIFFFITLCVGFAALNTGNNLLYLVLSLMLAFLVLSGVLSESALRGIEVTRRLPRELVAGTPARVGIEIRNHQARIPSFAVAVEDCARSGPHSRLDKDPAVGRCFALRVEAGGVETRHYRLRPERRGSIEFSGIRVVTRYPFGLFSKSRSIPLETRCWVYPPLGHRVAPAARRAHDEEGERPTREQPEGADVVGVRDYRSGDRLRRIHWRSSLRRGCLLVRDQQAHEGGQVEVRLRTRDVAADDVFEAGVARAASKVAAALEQGLEVGLRTDSIAIGAAAGRRQRRRLLETLAAVMPDAPARSGQPDVPGPAPPKATQRRHRRGHAA